MGFHAYYNYDHHHHHQHEMVNHTSNSMSILMIFRIRTGKHRKHIKLQLKNQIELTFYFSTTFNLKVQKDKEYILFEYFE